VTRPTIEGLGHATDCLEGLAWRCTANNDNGYHRLADLLDLLAWLDTGIEDARKAAAWSPGGERSPLGGGTIGSHTIGRHGLNRPVEGRLEWGTEEGRHQRGGPAQPPVEPNDRVYHDLRKLQRDALSTLTSLLAQWQHKAGEAGGWPRRSDEQTTRSG
jgi:hypothetical protein